MCVCLFADALRLSGTSLTLYSLPASLRNASGLIPFAAEVKFEIKKFVVLVAKKKEKKRKKRAEENSVCIFQLRSVCARRFLAAVFRYISAYLRLSTLL